MPLVNQRRRAWLLLATTISIHVVLMATTRRIGSRTGHSKGFDAALMRRTIVESTSTSDIPYREWYKTLPTHYQPLFLVLLLFILAFLFSFIGISASDFFCPNLSSVAAYLGLNESTAGVTFLAFGNGSPDVFSTFSAMSSGTVGLAIGELIGAASFIVSIVVGSIAFMAPFHVPRNAFLRDVIFFTAAVILLVLTLHDGYLTLYESGGMVGLYLLYVAVVVGGNWWGRRRKRKSEMKLGKTGSKASLKADYTRGRDSLSPMLSPGHQRLSPVSVTDRTRNDPDYSTSDALTPGRALVRRRSSTLSSPINTRPQFVPHQHRSESIDTATPRAGMSLLGAVEFRDVVNSLKKEGSSRPNSPGGTPMPSGGAVRGSSGGDYFGVVAGHRRSVSIGPSSLNNLPYARRQGSIVGRRRSSTTIRNSDIPDRERIVSAPAVSPHSPTPRPLGLGITSSESNPWSDQAGNPPTPSPFVVEEEPLSPTKPDLPKLVIPENTFAKSKHQTQPSVPSIAIVDPSGQSAPPALQPPTPALLPPPPRISKRQTWKTNIKHTLRVLFPSLQAFRHKSVVGMVLAVLAVPAILALTVTLPVVDDGGEMEEGGVQLGEDDDVEEDDLPGRESDSMDVGDEEELGEDSSDEEEYNSGEDEADRLLTPYVGEELHHLVDHGFSPLHSPLGRIHHASLRRQSAHVEAGYHGVLSPVRSEEEVESLDDVERIRMDEDVEEYEEDCAQHEALGFNKYLCAVQCVLGPLFCTFISFHDTSYFGWIALAMCLAGTLGAITVILWATDGTSQPWRLVRCFCGFICSMVWIAAIADQVVDVLGTVGEILGLSDAIIGLTIFAVGNSLADLVANVTVAQFAPAMAYAACFGGPMLNLLLGVGGSGTYHILTSPSHSAVSVNFSPTLWVSASGLVVMLVATAIVVPMNGYLVDRRWAACLVGAYVVLMAVNVGVELKTGRN